MQTLIRRTKNIDEAKAMVKHLEALGASKILLEAEGTWQDVFTNELLFASHSPIKKLGRINANIYADGSTGTYRRWTGGHDDAEIRVTAQFN